jgi:predicted nucleotide-binding protein
MPIKFEKSHKEFKDLLYASGILGEWVNMVSKFRFRWDNGGSFDWLPHDGRIIFEGSSTADESLKLWLFKILFNVAEIKPTPFLQRKTKIFVVCGEDLETQDQFEQMMNELHLGPNYLTSNNEEGLLFAEALEAQKLRKGDKVFGIVLLNADYRGALKTRDLTKSRPMYGPGLMLETGLLLSTMHADHMVVLAKKGMLLPTRLRGIRYLNYENNINEVKVALIEHMVKSGLNLAFKKVAKPPAKAGTAPKVKKPVKTTPMVRKSSKSINPNRKKTPPSFI